MLLTVLTVFFILFLFYGIHAFVLDKRFNLPPGPLPLPFIGSAYLCGPGVRFWELFRDLAHRYGPIFTFYFGHIRVINLNESKLINEVIVGQSDVFSNRLDVTLPGFESIPEALVTASNETWRQRRRFGMKAMRDFGMGKDAMVTKVQDEIVHLLPEIEVKNGKPFNPKKIINTTTSNIICSLVFGKRFNYDDAKFHRLLEELEIILSQTMADAVFFFMFPFIRHFADAKQAKQFRNMQKLTKKMVIEAIAESRQDYDPETIRGFPDLFIQQELTGDGLDLDSFSLTMTDMFVAGTETTATALSWTLLYLATYPDIQRRCQEVIDQVIETNRMPDLKDRARLPYIEAVMCEVLRHASIVPLSLVHSNREKHSKIGSKLDEFIEHFINQFSEYDVPPFTMIMYNVTALHYDPKYWKTPEEFNPDRWINPEDGKLLSHPGYFMPFGLGPRICLGEALARVEYFIIIVSLLHRFNFGLEKPVDFRSNKHGLINCAPDFDIIASLR